MFVNISFYDFSFIFFMDIHAIKNEQMCKILSNNLRIAFLIIKNMYVGNTVFFEILYEKDTYAVPLKK